MGLKERLTDVLIKQKLLTKQDLDSALKVQREKGGRLSELLVSLGYISRKGLMLALSQDLGIPPIDLSRFKIDPEVLKLVPAQVARHYEIIPVSLIGGTLTIAMADPLNIFAMDEIKRLTGMRIGPIITTEKDIQTAIDQYYGQATHQAMEDALEDIKKAKLKLLSGERGEAALDTRELVRLTKETPVVKITDLLLAEAVKLKASDILIEPLEHTLSIRYRVDGVLQRVEAPPKSMHRGIVSRIKVMSELDIAEQRLPQDGRFKIRLAGREVDFRVSVLPSSFGEKVALRILDKSQAMLDIEKLGFEPGPLKDLEQAAERPHGMILVCGPTGCGKTTTLYSILKYVDSPEKNLVSVEDPVEYQLEGINQVTSRPDIGLSFANALRSILRQDPDVIMVGEIRDYDTVDIAIKAALTGHLVLSTLHTTDAAGSVVRLVNMGVEPFLITSSVIMVAAQRLVRVICPHCKESYEPPPETLKKLGIKPVTKFYRGKGCRACLNTGYRGRIGIAEVLILTPKVRELILNRRSETEIKHEARQNGMTTLRENGMQKVINGITTLEEVLRVTAEDEEKCKHRGE